ncbi:uncharacterized protein LOC128683774 isoform X1 [Plodia interpunctella]|uniref:uncharacterized protein LOC128683774 isoform X1 n=1 Tax=Plodia interpunctella TaxID=58824 RepID=UPI0023675F1E|nr:uncharacterized protein LOC128683774 isoform X2 [Plodia interpunctella]
MLEYHLIWNIWTSLKIMTTQQEISFLQFIFYATIMVLSIDALEVWLIYKHRTACLKRLANYEATKLNTFINHFNNWVARKWAQFLYLREKNHTKAFLLVNIGLSLLFIIGNYINGYLLIYIICMTICLFYKLAPPLVKFVQKIQANAESDVELEGLIPDVTEHDINLLSIEPEPNPVVDERQSLDFWKPEDIPIEEASDSSENSSSLVTNLSIEKIQSLDKDIETSDSSEDEYTPIDHKKEQLKSTLETVQPTDTWSGTAYNALWNLTGAVANMVYTKPEESKRKRVSSIDSSDGFEMIDKNDVM